MKTTIDKAGRVVIPRELRRATGLVSGVVEITLDGAAVRIEAVSDDCTTEKRGRLVVEADTPLDDESVRSLRFADQR